jgi:hypothetical protein
MKIDKLSIDDLIRFIIAGFWFYFISIKTNNWFAGIFIDFKDDVMLTIACTIIGVLSYLIYRTLIYKHLLILVDKISGTTSRKIIGKELGIKRWETKNDIFHNIQVNNREKFPGNSGIWGSLIHMCYLVAILTLTGFLSSTLNCSKVWGLFVTFSILFITALIADLNLEKRLTIFFAALPELKEKLNAIKANPYLQDVIKKYEDD